MPLNSKTGLPVIPITPSQGAERSGRSTRTIFEYLKRGKLTRYRSGERRVFVDANEIDLVFALVADAAGGDPA